MAVMQLRGESAEPCAPRLSCWEGVWPGAATARARPGRPAPHGPSCPPPARCPCPPPLGPWGHPAAPAGSAPALAGGAGQEASSSALPRAGTALAAPRWVPPHSAPSALPLTQPGRRDAAWIHTTPTPLCRQRHMSSRGSEPPAPSRLPGWTRPSSRAQPGRLLHARTNACPKPSGCSIRPFLVQGTLQSAPSPGLLRKEPAGPPGRRPGRQTAPPLLCRAAHASGP